VPAAAAVRMPAWAVASRVRWKPTASAGMSTSPTLPLSSVLLSKDSLNYY
jgi:hypothetical protein